MNRLIWIVLVLLGLTSCQSIKTYNELIKTNINEKPLREDIDKLHSQLKKHHPKLYQYVSKEELDFKMDSLKKSITTPMLSRVFYKKLAPVISEVRQGHISLGSANKKFSKKERKVLKKKKFEFYDLDFEYLNDKLWVINTRGKDSSLVGAEVLRIEKDSVSELVENYKKQFSSDGYNKTMYDRAIGKYFSSFYYKNKGFKDSLKITFKKRDSLVVKTLKRIQKAKKNKHSLKVEKPKKLSNKEKKENKLAFKRKKKEKKKRGYISKRKQYTRNFEFIGKDSAVAYIKLRSFTNGNFRKFYKESFSKIDSAKIKSLVLDLRDNGGGRISEVDYLYSYLTNTKYQFMEDAEVNSRFPFFKYLMSNTSPISVKITSGILSPFIAFQNLVKTKKRNGKFYYKFKYSNYRKPKALNFKGKVYVLINGNSFSASSLISTHLKENPNVIFVGEETGGAYNGCVAGIYKIYELPNSKLRVRIGLMQIEAPYKQTPDGFGIKPDIKVRPTIEDRRLNQDPELNWVLEDIYTRK